MLAAMFVRFTGAFSRGVSVGLGTLLQKMPKHARVYKIMYIILHNHYHIISVTSILQHPLETCNNKQTDVF
jgi:hypothetical protein